MNDNIQSAIINVFSQPHQIFIFRLSGYPEEAKAIQDLYLSGKKDAAEAAVPDAYLESTSLIGEPAFVRDRLTALRESGVTSLNVNFVGASAADRVRECDALRNLVDAM